MHNKNLILVIVLWIAFSGIQIYGQPANWFGDLTTQTNTSFVDVAMINRGVVRATSPIQATVTKNNAKFLFNVAPGVWNPKWVGSTTNYQRTVNQRLTGADAAFVYTGGGWDRDLEVSIVNGRYYTFVIGDNSSANNDFSILETNYLPVDIQSVTPNTYVVDANQSVEITVVTASPLNNGEYGFLRYSTTNWTTSTIVPLTLHSGTTYKATIPGFPLDTEVSYYVFTSNQSSPSIADVDYLTLKINNNENQNYGYRVGFTVTCGSQIEVVTSQPAFPLADEAVTIFFNAELGNGGLINYSGNVYIHTGVITSLSTSGNDWRYVKTQWGQNTPETRMVKVDSNLYRLDITSIRNYYGVPANETIQKLAMVFRSDVPVSGNNYREGKNADGSDIFVDVYARSLQVKIVSPSRRNMLLPVTQPTAICVEAMENSNIKLYLDNQEIHSIDASSVTYALMPNQVTPGTHWIKAKASNNQGQTVTDSLQVYMRGQVVVEPLPANVNPGINYNSSTSVTLVLHDPVGLKQFAFVIGDFSQWQPTDQTYMKRTPDGKYFWITLNNLVSGREYAYQYYIDASLKIADPYCDKILDPWNDPWISTQTYPNLKRYPYDQTTGIVSVFQTNQQPYNWQISNFTPPAVNSTQQDLVIYELLIRDFVESKRIRDVIDSLDYFVRLGVNAIELMPIIEFDGNESWGYAPNFFFAPDKYYGTKNDYKRFIDECHQRNIAVILDIVPNHAFGHNPMVMMYFDKNAGEHGQPTSQNPWFNPTAPHPFSVGYDFNHESQHTRNFFKRVFEYWLTEYKVDGFRLDLSKGLTQSFSGENVGQWSSYDQSRINILTDYYNHIKSVNPNAYVILEHLANNDEETVLANTGLLLWGNMDDQFKQVILGYQDNSDFSWAYHSTRGWTYPNLVAYMESHDEERQMYEAYNYGNSSDGYNVRDTLTALRRMEMAHVLLFGIPGPKMLWQFGELGYDYSIHYGGSRMSAKPVRWDYSFDPNRRHLFAVTAAMINLQKHDAFRFGTFTHDLAGFGKRMWISHSSMNVVVSANAGVVPFDMAPG
ncbi:MAG TPA: alpha-amylase family glycosyl hydrolase, partial [Salinivirgaceae bacterium]|nr:alpha-amylase family glycosyl hydrolase [Salinivirgaceae bacterium]